MELSVVFNDEWVRERIHNIELEKQYIRDIEIELKSADVDAEDTLQIERIKKRLTNLYSALDKTKTSLENYVSRMNTAQEAIEDKVNQALYD